MSGQGGLPPGVPGHWLLGNLRDLVRHAYAFFADAAESRGGIATFRVLRRQGVVVSDVDLVEQVLVKNPGAFVKGAIYRNLEMLIGPGLVTHEGETWQQHRRIIQPGFHRRAIAHLVDVVNDAIARRFSAGDVSLGRFDATFEVRAITQQVISEVLLGTPVDAWRSARFTENFYEGQRLLVRRNWSLVRWPLWVPTRVNRGLRRVHGDLRAFLSERVDVRLAEGVGRRGDMLDLLLLAHVPPAADGAAAPPGGDRPAGPARLSRDAVLGEMSTLFSAGYDTTSSALAWAMYFLAIDPEAQARLHAEIDAVLGGRPPGWDDLERLEYTTRVLQEAMRLHPPIHSLSRDACTDVELGGYRVPAGTNVILSIYGVHRSPRYWPEPETFDPNRFLPGSPRAGHPKAYLPFSIGRRQCIGANFATTEAQLVLANLGQRFRWRMAGPVRQVGALPGTTHYPETFHLVLEPRRATP